MAAQFTISIHDIIAALKETDRFPSDRFEAEEISISYYRAVSDRKNSKRKENILVLDLDLDDVHFSGDFKD